MNSLQRIVTAVGFGTPDRIPVIPQVFGHTATLAGIPVDQYVRDGSLLARCQMKALDYYNHDAVFALMDVGVETEALGSVLDYRTNHYPSVQTYALAEGGNLDNLRLPDPRRDGRMPELLKAAGILRREVGDDVLVVGCVLGPVTLATQLLGAEAALYLAADNPEQYARILDFAVEVAILFGVAQIEAGVHLPVVFDPFSTSEVIPAAFFREFSLPRLQRVFAGLKKAGAVVNWLHIAGQNAPILPYLSETGTDIVNFDFCVNPSHLMGALPRTCVDGNIKPLDFIQATPETIAQESARLLALFAQRQGFILSSGCEIPPDARPENVAAMVTATRQKG